MNTFGALLQEFESVLQRYNPVNLSKLKAPLPDDVIRSYLIELGIEDEDVFKLYQWRNGADDLHHAGLFYSNCTLLPLGDVLKYKRDNVLELSNPHLTMIFYNGEDGLLFNNEKSTDYGRFHLYCVPLLSIDPPQPYYDSLTTMLQATLESYKKGVFFYDTDNVAFEYDVTGSIEIYNQFNPHCRFYDYEVGEDR